MVRPNLRPRRPIAVAMAVLLSLVTTQARADDAPDAPLTLKEKQEKRFPQAVRVGRLPGEAVVEHGVALRKLGVAVGVFRTDDDELQLVFRYGGILGFGGRIIAPPLEEVSLVGPMIKINELDHSDLAALPTFTGAGGKFLAPNETIRMGIDRKY